MDKARSNTLISGIVTSMALVKRSQEIVIELSDTLEHSRRLIEQSSSIMAKLKIKQLFEDAT